MKKKGETAAKVRSVRVEDSKFNKIIEIYGSFTKWIDMKIKSDRKLK